MSAIAGVVDLGGDCIDAALPARMLRALCSFAQHPGRSLIRGPAGFVVQPGNFTPEDRYDHQPCQPHPGDIMIMDGRIDNRADLIARLGLNPAEAIRLADSTLVEQIWRRDGADCLPHLIGDFVIAHWSAKNRRLTCARGSTRGRMLFFHRNRDRFFFSSALQGLFALPEIPRKIDETALADHLLYNLSDGATLYRDIEMLPPYGWLTFDQSGMRQGYYWQANPDHRLHFHSETETWEALRALFEQVVRDQLRAAQPIGIMMSGGLDSAIVAGQAARILAETGTTLPGYTLVPATGAPEPTGRFSYGDETDRVNTIAAMYANLQPHLISAGDTPMSEGLRGVHAADQWGYRESLSFTTGKREIFHKAAADGVRILLAGTLGNSTITYNGRDRIGRLLKTGHFLTLAGELRALKHHRGVATDILRSEMVSSIFPPTLTAFYRRLRRRTEYSWDHFSLISPEFAIETGAAARWKAGRSVKALPRNGWARRWRPLSCNVCGYEPGVMTQFGMERRDPTGDRRIIEFCLALPEEYYFKDGVLRRLARCGMAHLLPPEIASSELRGIQDTDWSLRLRQERSAIGQTLDQFAEDPQISHYMDIPKMQAALQRFDTQDWHHASQQQVIAIKQGLLGGIAVGQFVRWVSGRN